MRVLVINWRDMENPEAGGAEVHIHEILKRKPADWEIDFISATFPGCAPVCERDGYKVTRIANNSLFNFTFKTYYKKHLRHKNYDLIIDDISKIPLATPRYIKDTPILAIQHHVHGQSLFKQLPYPMALYVYHMEKFWLRAYTKTPLISVSESSRDNLLSLYPFEKITVLHNGIDFKALHKAPKASPSLKPVILYLGRLKKYKRVDHLIQALAILKKDQPQAELHIAGKGDDEARLLQITRELGLNDSVRFLGFIDEARKQELLHQSAVFAIASEKEGWGISVIEANAAGLPAVGYNVEGLRDSIRHEKTGFLVNNGDIVALAEKLGQLIKKPDLRTKFSTQAVEFARTFSWDHTAEQFYAICLNVIQDFKGSSS